MATYLNFVSIGHFALEQGVVDGLPYVYAVTEQLGAEERQRAFTALQTSDEKVRVLAELFGPYPFTELGGVVVAAELGFDGLETQTRPVYRAAGILDAGDAGAGDGLVGAGDEADQTGLVVERLEHRHRGHRRAVGVGDDPPDGLADRVRVDLADHEGHLGVATPGRGVVDDRDTGGGEPRRLGTGGGGPG